MLAPIAKNSRIGDLSGERLINYFVRPSDGASPLYLVGRPGLVSQGKAGGAVVQMLEMGGDLYAVANDGLYKFNGAGFERIAEQSFVASATAAANHTQIAIVSSNKYYLYDGETLTETATGAITDPVAVVYQDGYFLVAGTSQGRGDAVTLSGLRDGTTFDASDFAFAEDGPDDIVGMATLSGLVYMLGKKTVQPFANVGNPDFPFQPNPGATFRVGCSLAASVAAIENAIYWFGEDGKVRRTVGFAPEVISTREVEKSIAARTVLKGFIYYVEGHQFYVLCMNEGTCPAYDMTTGMWCEFSSGVDHFPWIGTCSYIYNNTQYVGCYSGDVCTVGGHNDADQYDVRAEIFGTPINVGGDEFVIERLYAAFITGRDDIGENAHVCVQTTRDRVNWSAGHWRSLGRLGQYRRAAEWYSLGTFKDCQLRIWITDEVCRDLEGVTLS